MKTKSVNAPCVVCGSEGKGNHFGAETCRACAAFFRRTIAFNHKYKCRSSGSCLIEKPGRCACRSCRFTKCLKMGMKMKAVHLNRDGTGSHCEDSCSSNGSPESDSFFDLNDKMPCLWRIQGNYFQLYNIRRVMHKKGPTGASNEPPRSLNYKECDEQYTKEIGVTRNFLENAFPEFRKLDESQQNVLFKNFYAKWLLLEPCYFSQLHKTTEVWFMASGDFVTWKDANGYFTDTHESEFMTKEEVLRVYDMSTDCYQRNTFDAWSRFEVKDIEFYALLSFIVWEVGLEGQTTETEEIAEKCRQTITKELVYYYKNVLRDSDYGLRLTNLMSLLQTNQRALRKWQEDTQIGKVFNAYGFGKTIYEYIMML